jgi:DNA-binding MarR family transcriptional regulator
MNPRLQQTLLEHLRHAALTRTQLVGRTDWTDHQVQAALDTLVGEGLVRRRPRPGRSAEYELTPAAAAHLPQVNRSAGRATGAAVVTTKRRPRWLQPSRVPTPPDPRTQVLTAADRSFCSAALAQQFDAGRIVEVFCVLVNPSGHHGGSGFCLFAGR